jgi:sugar diacid utilization regulator
MGLRVDEMLRLEPLQELQLIAGSKGLHRVIEHVSVLGIPDKFDPFLVGGEFILTTFHSLSTDQEGQVEAIRKFSEAGVTAVGIHPFVTGTRFCDKLLETADFYNLPIVLLPPSMSYTKIFSVVLGTILNRQSQLSASKIESRLKADFLAELIEGKFIREEVLYRRANSIGLNLERKHITIIASIEWNGMVIKHLQDQKMLNENKIYATVRTVLEKHSPGSEVLLHDNTAIVFMHFDPNTTINKAKHQARQLSELVQQALANAYSGTAITVGIGNYYESPVDLSKSFNDAQYTLDVGTKIFGSGSIISVQELGVYGVLGKTSKARLSEFPLGILEQLLQYDHENQTELVKTVEVYLDSKESFLDVAKKLYVHRNTVKYRIQKVREVLGFDPFKNPVHQLNFHLALKVRHLLH